MTEGIPQMIPVKAWDPDYDKVQVGMLGLSGASLSYTPGPEIQGFIAWTPSSADVGLHEVTIMAIDEHETMTVIFISVEVIPRVPDIEFLEPAQRHYTVVEMGHVFFGVEAKSDIPVDSILFVLTSNLPSGCYYFNQESMGNPATAVFSFNPELGDEGTYQLTFTASSGPYTESIFVTIDVLPNTQFLLDWDGDGIWNDVDTNEILFSDDFSDLRTGGTTYGTVHRRDQTITVYDAVNPMGVYIIAEPGGGPQPAEIIACGSTKFYLPAGIAMRVDCSSVQLKALNGTVDGVFFLSDSVNATFSLSKGNTIFFDTNDRLITAPSTNFGGIELGVNGEIIEIGPQCEYSFSLDDSIVEATELFPSVPLVSELEHIGDWDFYMFKATRGRFVVETWGDVDSHLTLYDSDGVTEIIEDDDSGRGFNASITWNVTDPDKYYIKVRGSDKEALGRYKILISNATSRAVFFRRTNCLNYIVNYTLNLKPSRGKVGELLLKFTDWAEHYPYQDSRLISATMGSEDLPVKKTVTDRHGNLVLTTEKIRLRNQAEILLRFNVTIWLADCDVDPSKVGPYDTDSELYRLYTNPEERIESDDPVIIDTANAIIGNETNARINAENILRWVYGNIEYCIPGGDRSARTTLERRTGVCEDYANLYIALCRAVGIPARMSRGHTVNLTARSIRSQEGHAWTEVYLPNYGWIFADPTWNMFEDNDLLHVLVKQGLWSDALGFGSEFSGTAWDFNWDNAERFVSLEILTTDTDKDGISNLDEFTYETDAFDKETDEELLSNWKRVLEYDPDPATSDIDEDGLLDVWELFTYKTDPFESDTDGDGLGDSYEVYVQGSDPKEKDTDGDGLEDGDELYTYDTDPVNADSDNDGVQDGGELTYNTDPLDRDTDKDRLSDGEEIFEYQTDPLETDSDEDGIEDGDEVFVYKTSPIMQDTDGDQLYDRDEVVEFETDPLNTDTDGDGISDGVEVERGSDPLQAFSSVKVFVEDTDGKNIKLADVESRRHPEGQQLLSGSTSEAGYVYFEEVSPGVYTFEASKEGYEDNVSNLYIAGGDSVEIIIVLKRQSSVERIGSIVREIAENIRNRIEDVVSQVFKRQ